jgi:isopenicillin N synthase-like dioxygenase
MPVAFTAIPVMSLARWTSAAGDSAARLAFADELCRVCHEVGFLLLSDHGVGQQFLDDYFAALQQFFALPEAVKAAIDKVQSPHFRGWERVGSELTDNRVDHREQLDLSTEHPPRPADTIPRTFVSMAPTSGRRKWRHRTFDGSSSRSSSRWAASPTN